ncbi:MAG TPA: transposase [Gemmatirosa sp.]|nr:transposase [Gemmatirosa sp.]
MPHEAACRHGMAEKTYYRWKAQHGGLQVNEARKLKALEEENRRLKRSVADQALDLRMPKDVVGEEW